MIKKWDEFRARYFKELEQNDKFVDANIDKVREGSITPLYSSKEEQFKNATSQGIS